jgi:hypothetical protein
MKDIFTLIFIIVALLVVFIGACYDIYLLYKGEKKNDIRSINQ